MFFGDLGQITDTHHDIAAYGIVQCIYIRPRPEGSTIDRMKPPVRERRGELIVKQFERATNQFVRVLILVYGVEVSFREIIAELAYKLARDAPVKFAIKRA